VLGLLLMGYALAGGGFARLGAGGIFVGEICLAFGVLAFLADGRVTRIFNSAPSIALLLFIFWGLACTVPYIPEYRIDALRDGVLYGYGAFAFILGGLLCAKPSRFVQLMRRYQKFVYVFLALIPIIYLNARLGGPTIDVGYGDRLPTVKGGEMMVHLAGALALYMQFGLNSWRWMWVGLLGLSSMMAGVFSRGGAVAYLMSASFTMFLQPANKRGWSTVGAVLLLVIVMAVSGIKVDLGKNREISFEQFWQNVQSTVGDGDANNLSSTKEWRLNWWTKIIGYTFGGEYFWMGKGFGVNLASDDGFQVSAGGELRSPHNGHMSVLARSGVPGLFLWVCVLGLWFSDMLRSFYLARRRGDADWSRLFLFFMSFFIAFIVEASFDVYLEGPMGGIWFWCLYGTGIAARWIYLRYPDILDADAEPVTRPDPNVSHDEPMPVGMASLSMGQRIGS